MRLKFTVILGLLALAGILLQPCRLTAAEGPRPNILLIISDDQAWTDYGFMGHPHIQTPHLDRLAAESLIYTRGYSVVPLCRPSLASMATGLYPHQHRVTGNDPRLPGKDAPRSMQGRQMPQHRYFYEQIIRNFTAHPNVIGLLNDLGYATFQTGKWWEGNPVKTAGFDEAMTRGEGRGARHGDDGLVIGREGIQPITDFIEKHSGQPFFIWHAPFLPHTPHTPPDALFTKYEPLAPTPAVARYWAMCEWFDQTCGDLMNYLEDRRLRDNTVILYVCDNGWIQDADRPNRFAPRSKQTAYEGGIRTPIMISWPGQIQPRFDRQHLASSIDLLPTVRALLQLPPAPQLPGINLLDPRAVTQRPAIFGASFQHDILDVHNPAASLKRRWMIQGDWKLLLPASKNLPDAEVELFQLGSDPQERNNRAPEDSDRVQAMRATLDRWWDPGQ